MLPLNVLAMSAPPSGAENTSSPLLSFLPLILIFAVFWFMIIRPQKKQQTQRKLMLEAVKRGDRVLTSGGLYGTVRDVKQDVVVIQIAENVKVEIAKAAITGVTPEEG